VPSQRPSHESADTLTQAVFTTVPQGRTFFYRVNRGDTLVGIASRYAVTTQDLRQWNNLARNGIAVGQQLRVTSDSAPDAAKSRRASGRAGKVMTVAKGHVRACCASGKAHGKPIANGKAITRSAKAGTQAGG
jgi:membrane-bound lytic murein transglycosylase D